MKMHPNDAAPPYVDVSIAAKELPVRLSFNYVQHYEPKRSRQGKVLAIDLSHQDSLSVREVDPRAAPVAYRVTRLTDASEYSRERVGSYEIRTFDGALWWPMVGRDGPLSGSRLMDLAAEGRESIALAFDGDAWLSHTRCPTKEKYFDRHPARKLTWSDQDDRWDRAVRGARGVIICGGVVYLDGGEPVWFAESSPLRDRLYVRIGCSSLDRGGSIYHGVPGPSRGSRSRCASEGLAFGLDELRGAMDGLRAQATTVEVNSRIEPLAILHRADAGPLVCERALARSLWHQVNRRNSPGHLPLEKAVPALASALAPNASIENLDCREALIQLASLPIGDADNEYIDYDELIMTARAILERLKSFGTSLLANEDDAALGNLAP